MQGWLWWALTYWLNVEDHSDVFFRFTRGGAEGRLEARDPRRADVPESHGRERKLELGRRLDPRRPRLRASRAARGVGGGTPYRDHRCPVGGVPIASGRLWRPARRSWRTRRPPGASRAAHPRKPQPGNYRNRFSAPSYLPWFFTIRCTALQWFAIALECER
jgi:hypothetical protein